MHSVPTHLCPPQIYLFKIQTQLTPIYIECHISIVQSPALVIYRIHGLHMH